MRTELARPTAIAALLRHHEQSCGGQSGVLVQRLDDPGMAEFKRALRPPEEHISEWKPDEYEVLQRVGELRGQWEEEVSEGERLEMADIMQKHNLQEALVPLVLDHVDTLWTATADRQDLSGLMAVLSEICELEFKERRNVLH